MAGTAGGGLLRRGAALRRFLPSAERAGLIGFIGAASFLVYLYGALSADFRWFPYGMVQGAYKASLALIRSNTELEYTSHLFTPTGEAAVGAVTRNDGTLPNPVSFTSNHAPDIYLVDRSGKLVHRWTDPFPADRKRELSSGMFSPFLYYHPKYKILSNGDVVGLFFHYDLYPKSLALYRMDRDSRLLWSDSSYNYHHDVDVAPDGRTFAVASINSDEADTRIRELPTPYVIDLIVILDEQGKVTDRIDLLAAIRDSGYSYFLSPDVMPFADPNGDYLHTNGVKYITPELAENFPHGEAGDLLISMRNIHAFGVLNVATRTFTWLTRGSWIGQHDPDLLDNGNILLFDNLSSDTPGGRSKVMEIDSRTLETVWSHEGDAKTPFETHNRGSQQRTSTGNTLITESNTGRIFEVTPGNEIVWEFRNPLRKGTRTDLVPVVRWGEEVDLDALTPDFRAYLERRQRRAACVPGSCPD